MNHRHEVDFDQSLSWNLEKMAIRTYGGFEMGGRPDSGLRLWIDESGPLGSFFAHEGWRILRKYNLCGRLGLAIKEAESNAPSYDE